MFGTSIHWTTFFYLLVDIVILLVALFNSKRKLGRKHRRFLNLGFLFIVYNLIGGLLTTDNFPGPIILEYIITYGVAIFLCVYVIHYLYKEFNIVVLKFNSSVRNIAILTSGSFISLFLIPYFITNSLRLARFAFTIPIAIAAFTLLWIFYKKISKSKSPNNFLYRRLRLSMISITSIALLPVLAIIGDYQWLNSSVMNIGFYAITYIEVERYFHFLENKTKLYQDPSPNNDHKNTCVKPNILYKELTPREFEVALSILGSDSYKKIAKQLFIAENTVSKHASNIFKKTGVNNRCDFVERFKKNIE